MNGIEYSKEKYETLEIYDNIRGKNYGFLSEPLKLIPHICEVNKKFVKTDDEEIYRINMHEITKNDLYFITDFKLTPKCTT